MVVRRIAIAASVFSIVVAGCAVGGRHTPDSEMEERFFSNQARFAALLAEVTADDKLGGLGADGVRYGGHIFSGGDFAEMERLGFSEERWARYRQQMRELGVAQITKGEGALEFRVDQGRLWNGDSYKGYEYSLVPPLGHRKASLDKYRLSAEDKIPFGGYQVYRPLQGNWYLYLFINGGS